MVKRSSERALHLVIAEDKKHAYYLVSDLDNFIPEQNLFFFPATSEKSEYKRSTALLQRTATLSAIASAEPEFKPEPSWDNAECFEIGKELLARTPVSSSLIVTYPEAMTFALSLSYFH